MPILKFEKKKVKLYLRFRLDSVFIKSMHFGIFGAVLLCSRTSEFGSLVLCLCYLFRLVSGIFDIVETSPLTLLLLKRWNLNAKTMRYENLSSSTRSEDQLGERWDRCLADTSIKLGTIELTCKVFLPRWVTGHGQASRRAQATRLGVINTVRFCWLGVWQIAIMAKNINKINLSTQVPHCVTTHCLCNYCLCHILKP